MPTLNLLARLAICTASTILPLAAASADQLNWDNYNTNTNGNPLPLAAPYSYNYDIGSTRVNVAITGATSAFQPTTNGGPYQAPAIGKEFEGGLTPAENTLEIAALFAKNTDTITVTVSFTTLAGVAKPVNGVSFNLFDIDRGATNGQIVNTTYGYNDQIANIQAVLGGNVIRQAVVTGTNGGNAVSGNATAGYVITGVDTINNTGTVSNGANANINFGTTQNLTSFSFTYGDNTQAALGGVSQDPPVRQVFGLHDINFTPVAVPEPTTTVTLAMAGVLAGMIFLRRRDASQK